MRVQTGVHRHTSALYSLGGDGSASALAVGELRGDGEASLAADGHADEALVPALDDLSAAEDKRERLAGRVGVKLLAGRELANVSHAKALAALGDGTGADRDVLDDQAGSGGALQNVSHG